MPMLTMLMVLKICRSMNKGFKKMIKIPGIPPLRKRQSIIGSFSLQIISMLSLDIEPGTPIFISETNREHIREHHPDTYRLYFDQISDIISNPDYKGK